MNFVSQYFKEEKKESVFFIAVGVFSCLLSLFFLFIKKEPFSTGVSYAFISIGLIQLVVGITVYLRSDIDTVRVNHYVEKESKSIEDYEIPRMTTVMKNFAIYRWIEIVLIFIGLTLLFFFESKTLGNGLGIGLAIQSSIMLVLDYFAEKRGKIYLQHLASLDQTDIS